MPDDIVGEGETDELNRVTEPPRAVGAKVRALALSTPPLEDSPFSSARPGGPDAFRVSGGEFPNVFGGDDPFPGESSVSVTSPTVALGSSPPSAIDRVTPPRRGRRQASGFPLAEIPTLETQFAPLAEPAEKRAPSRSDRYLVIRNLELPVVGWVRLVRDTYLERTVALKELGFAPREMPLTGRVSVEVLASDDSESTFISDVRLSGRLEHSGILPVYELNRNSAGLLYATFPAFQGMSLSTALVEHDPAFLRRVLWDLLAVFETVAFAHSQGVAHRNLSSDVVVVRGQGCPLVLGWRAPKEREGRAGRRVSLTGESFLEQEALLGADPFSRQPENGEPEAAELIRVKLDRSGARDDVFSLGTLLVECLSAKYPQGASDPSGAREQLRGAVELGNRQWPLALSRLANTALAPNPSKRPPDASLLAQVLRDHLMGERTEGIGLAGPLSLEGGVARRFIERVLSKSWRLWLRVLGRLRSIW